MIEARYCVMATGCLSVPRDPDFEGADSFKGERYETARWPHEPVDFTGKRVAVIGTGSSGTQAIPLIAKEAAQVYVFQRTPNFSVPARNKPLSDEDVAKFRQNFSAYRQLLKSDQPIAPLPPPDADLNDLAARTWRGGGLYSVLGIPNLTRDEQVNQVVADYIRGKIAEIVDDPDIAEKLTPRGYPVGSKRPCVDTDYFATFNRENVELVDLRETPIAMITPTGVRTSQSDYPVDVIVYATGFDAMTGALLRIDIRGRNGIALRDVWAAGPKTYLGLQVAGFPNLFTVTGPGSPSVLSNMITSCEQHVDWIADAIGYMREKGLATMEAGTDAQEAWVAHVNDEADKTLYPRASSWYIGANVPGKPRVFMPYVGANYRTRCDAIAARGYEGFAFNR